MTGFSDKKSLMSLSRPCGKIVVACLVVLLIVCLTPNASAQKGQGRQGRQLGQAKMGQAGGAELEAFKAKQQSKTQEFLVQEAADGKAFVDTISSKPKHEIISATREFKTAQYEKNSEFREKMHNERLTFVEARMGKNPNMPADMKEKRLSSIKADYEEMKVFFAKKHAENMAFLDKMLVDETMEGAALNKALQGFFQSQKDSAKVFMGQKKPTGQNMPMQR